MRSPMKGIHFHHASRGGWRTYNIRAPMRFTIKAEQGENTNSEPTIESKSRRRRRQKQPTPQSEGFTLENLNPISMGRKSRVLFDDVWIQLQRIGGPSRSITSSIDISQYDLPETFESPQATSTTILVVGATGRVGRILVRKLLLRGYKVRALVRQRSLDASTTDDPSIDAIPQSVEVILGDVGEYAACRAAVEGVDKVIYCAAARTTLATDLARVDDQGVALISRAFQDAKNAEARRTSSVAPSSKIDVADFKKEEYHPLWDIEHVGPPTEDQTKKGYYPAARRKAIDRARDSAEAYINEEDSLVFEGAVYSREGYADVGAPLNLPHGVSLHNTEGLVFRVLGDGQAYSVMLETDDGSLFASKVTTRQGYSTIRLPFNGFLPAKGVNDDAVLDPGSVCHIRVRFEPKQKFLDQVTQPGQSMYDNSANRFHLEVDWIKALPGGTETDFILVSCAGTRRSATSAVEDAPLLTGEDPSIKERIMSAKRRGEASLRNSGLGYTVIRPGPLAEEAGGYKALVFDQGNRITESIACADVADVCLKALHDVLARNKTFEVCWEYTPEEGLESYELVAHLPDKANNYLSPALATLQRNT